MLEDQGGRHRRAQRRRPPPGHPGSPGGCSSRRGRRREAGLAPLTWGGVVAWAAAASNCALLTLLPPPPPAAGMWLLPGSQSQQPRVQGACGQGYFLTRLKASVGSRVFPWLFPFLRPAHFAPFLLAMLVVLLSGIDCFLGGLISTCKKCPASKLTAWAVTDTHPHPRACCGCSVS